MTLSPRQFKGLAARLDQPGSGFSVNTTTGREPRTGYMVSQPGGNRKLTAPTTGTDIKRYEHDNKDELDEPGKFLGTWHSEDHPGVIDADISERFPDRSRRAAMKETVMNKEEAAFHLIPGHEWGGEDVKNVVHPANKPPDWMTPEQAKAHKAGLTAASGHLAAGYRKQEGRPSLKKETQARQARTAPAKRSRAK